MVMSIQCLRGIAALMVVAFHCLVGGNESGAGRIGALAAGVDIFFVISGFVMVASTETRKWSPRAFMTARVMRIVPLYWLALVGTLLLIHIGVMSRTLPSTHEIALAFSFVFYTDLFTGQPLPFLGVGWTLNYEMAFYILFAATLRLSRWRQIMLISLVFAFLFVCRRWADPTNAFQFRMTSPLPFEFVGGMILAASRSSVRRLPAIVAIASIFVGALLLSLTLPVPRFIGWGGPALAIVTGSVRLEPWFANWAGKAFARLGDISYSLYLTHPLTLAVLSFASVLPASRSVLVLLQIVACVLVASVSGRFLERPIQNAIRSIRKRGSADRQEKATSSQSIEQLADQSS